MEAFHYLFHPLTQRLLAIAESGELGRIEHVATMVAIPAPSDSDPRWSSARAGTRSGLPGVDEWLDAELAFPGGATGSARCHMGHGQVEMAFRIVGAKGEALAHNFVQPHLDDRLTVTTDSGSRIESLGTRSSYTYQLEAFAAAIRQGRPLPIDSQDAVSNMVLIDAAYTAAGLPVRPSS